MKKILISFAFLFSSVAVQAQTFEITNPAEMVTCLKNYIQQTLVPQGRMIAWEYAPTYKFIGKYAFASWHSNPGMEYGVLGIKLSSDEPVYCDMKILADGNMDRAKPGFCKATITHGDVVFNYTTFIDGQEVEVEKNAIVVTNSKIFCINAPRM